MQEVEDWVVDRHPALGEDSHWARCRETGSYSDDLLLAALSVYEEKSKWHTSKWPRGS